MVRDSATMVSIVVAAGEGGKERAILFFFILSMHNGRYMKK